MTVVRITCRRIYHPDPKCVVWFWRELDGMACDAYESIVMSVEPPEPRPGEHGIYGNIDQRLGLGR